jgi:hypothetical protein
MKHYLFTTYYEPKSQERKAEYDFCIQKNKVASFDKIFLLVEGKDVEAASKLGVEVVEMIPSRRPTFKDFFDFMHAEEFADSVNVVANTDIFFLNMQQIDANMHRLQKGKSCFALTRYDYHHTLPSQLFDRPDSQDTWVFNGFEGLSNVAYADFTMGVGGCDNRLAHELKEAGFEVLNPSRSILTFHLHDVPLRTFNESVERVPPPYLLLPPTF